MGTETPIEFTITLPKETVETILRTLIGAAEITSVYEAHHMLSAADTIKQQVSLSGFTVDVQIPPAAKPKRGKWLR